MTLEKIEELAAQLSPQEQLKLLACIGERLSQLPSPVQETDAERQCHEYAARIDTFLAACDEVAEQIEGEFDSAEDLRQIREERTGRP